MTLHSKYIKGNLAFWDTHRKRLIDAVGPDVIKYNAEPWQFGETGSDPAGWVTTVVEVGTGTSEANGSASAGAVIDLITAANENDGVSTQMGAEPFELTSDQELYFGVKLKINDVTQSDWFIGLAVADTAILGGVTDRIGFQSVDASTTITFPVEKNSTETNATVTGGTLVDDTYIELEWYWDGSGLELFVDGVSAGTPATTNLPDDVPLRLSMEFLTGEAVAQTMTIEYLRVIQIGR